MNEQALASIGARLRRNRAAALALDSRLALRRFWRDRRYRSRDAALLRDVAGRTDLRINVGSSEGIVPGWVNVDLMRDADGRIFRLDATQPWPFEPGSAEAINSEHFIEHLTLDEARAYFVQAFRALRPGGVIRTSTPDMRAMAEAYLGGDDSIVAEHRAHGYAARDLGDMVNNYFLSHGHRHIHDAASLEALLGEAGFGDITLSSFGESEHELLHGIDVHDNGPGLNRLVVVIDAVKPADTGN